MNRIIEKLDSARNAEFVIIDDCTTPEWFRKDLRLREIFSKGRHTQLTMPRLTLQTFLVPIHAPEEEIQKIRICNAAILAYNRSEGAFPTEQMAEVSKLLGK